MANVVRTQYSFAVHPGFYLEVLLKEKGISADAFAQVIDEDIEKIRAVIAGKQRINAELAEKISVQFGTSEEIWLDMQQRFDAETAGQNTLPR